MTCHEQIPKTDLPVALDVGIRKLQQARGECQNNVILWLHRVGFGVQSNYGSQRIT